MRQAISEQGDISYTTSDYDLAISGDGFFIVQSADGTPVLTWHVTVATADPAHDWNLFIDANTGERVATWDAIKTVTGSGLVYEPNPVQSTGTTTLADGGDGDTAALDAARSSQAMNDLLPSIGTLEGSYADLTATGITGSTLPPRTSVAKRRSV